MKRVEKRHVNVNAESETKDVNRSVGMHGHEVAVMKYVYRSVAECM
jgi:hypothetical protein